MAEIAEMRARLARMEHQLARLMDQHDDAMSAFRFDEANQVQQQIAALHSERLRLSDQLPKAPPEPSSAPSSAPYVPAIMRRPGRPRPRHRH